MFDLSRVRAMVREFRPTPIEMGLLVTLIGIAAVQCVAILAAIH